MARGHKTGGRTAGTANKFTQEMRDRLQGIFDNYAEGQLHLDLQATDPETRMRFMVEVAKLITPKPPTIAGYDNEERPIFTGINLDVAERSFPILSIDPLDDGCIQITRRIINGSDKEAE